MQYRNSPPQSPFTKGEEFGCEHGEESEYAYAYEYEEDGERTIVAGEYDVLPEQ